MEQGEKYNTATTNGNKSRKGKPRKWKDLPVDPLADGFETYQATVIVGKTPVTWESLPPGALFSRNQLGKSLHCKIDASKAVSLDTNDDLEVAPKYRETLKVWKVTSFNSTTD